jgi:hypothetical protein
MENPIYKDKKDREYKCLAQAIQSVCNSLSGDNIVILSILSRLELGPLFSIRRTFSRDSMLKAYLLLRLKKIKSYRALVNYLRNRPEEAIALGFDKNSDGSVRIPTHQDISHFVRFLSKKDMELADFVIKTIEDTAERLGIELDVEKKTIVKKDASPKTIYNHKIEKTAEMVKFAKSRLVNSRAFSQRYNAIFRNGEFIDELMWLGFEHNFAESGCRIISSVSGRRMPNADTLLYHIKKNDLTAVEEFFSKFMEMAFRDAKQKGLISGRAVDVAIDATPAWRFYGDRYDRDGREVKGIEGYKPERGTSYAYQFITLDIVEHNERITLIALPVFHRADQNRLVEQLLSYAKSKVRISRVLLDRGFFDAECINMLNRMGLRYIMPAKVNSRDVRKVSRLTAPRIVPNCAMKGCRFNLVVTEVQGEKYYFATNIPTRSDDLIFAFRIKDLYRRRWQIESGYRTKKYAFLPKTTSKNYTIRYFYFMMAVILYNYWVIADIAVLLYLGLNTKNTQITAKEFCIKAIGMERKPAG